MNKPDLGWIAKYNPYRDNPNRTVCEALIYDQGYEQALKEMRKLWDAIKWSNQNKDGSVTIPPDRVELIDQVVAQGLGTVANK